MSRVLKIEDTVREIKKNFEKFDSVVDALVILCHSTLLEDGFEVVVKQESGNFEKCRSFLPEGWNSNKDSFTFHYKHPRSSRLFVLKFVPMVFGEGGQLIVHGLMVEKPDIPFGVQLKISDFVVEKMLENIDHVYKEYQSFFTILRQNIVFKFIPELQPQRTNQQQQQRQQRQQRDQQRPNQDDNPDPLRIGPVRRPIPQNPNDFFNNYGVDDIAPMGTRPVGGGFGILGGGGGSSGFGGFTEGGGGMLFGPQNFTGGQGMMGRGGRGGGRGRIPHARYDPIFGIPNSGGSGIPDNNSLRRPGSNNNNNDDDDNFFF